MSAPPIFYGLDKYNLKQTDQYVWQLGKEYFPKNYEKNELRRRRDTLMNLKLLEGREN